MVIELHEVKDAPLNNSLTNPSCPRAMSHGMSADRCTGRGVGGGAWGIGPHPSIGRAGMPGMHSTWRSCD